MKINKSWYFDILPSSPNPCSSHHLEFSSVNSMYCTVPLSQALLILQKRDNITSARPRKIRLID